VPDESSSARSATPVRVAKPARLRGRSLLQRRAAYLRQHPLCAHCAQAGRTTLAVELDHIIALCNGGPDTVANLQGLCLMCHALKTARDKGTRLPVRIGLDGFPLPLVVAAHDAE